MSTEPMAEIDYAGLLERARNGMPRKELAPVMPSLLDLDKDFENPTKLRLLGNAVANDHHNAHALQSRPDVIDRLLGISSLGPQILYNGCIDNKDFARALMQRPDFVERLELNETGHNLLGAMFQTLEDEVSQDFKAKLVLRGFAELILNDPSLEQHPIVVQNFALIYEQCQKNTQEAFQLPERDDEIRSLGFQIVGNISSHAEFGLAQVQDVPAEPFTWDTVALLANLTMALANVEPVCAKWPRLVTQTIDLLEEEDPANVEIQELTLGPQRERDEGRNPQRSSDEYSDDESSDNKHSNNEPSKDEHSKDERSKDERSKDERSKDERSKDERSKDERSKDEHSEDEHSEDERESESEGEPDFGDEDDESEAEKDQTNPPFDLQLWGSLFRNVARHAPVAKQLALHRPAKLVSRILEWPVLEPLAWEFASTFASNSFDRDLITLVTEAPHTEGKVLAASATVDYMQKDPELPRKEVLWAAPKLAEAINEGLPRSTSPPIWVKGTRALIMLCVAHSDLVSVDMGPLTLLAPDDDAVRSHIMTLQSQISQQQQPFFEY